MMTAERCRSNWNQRRRRAEQTKIPFFGFRSLRLASIVVIGLSLTLHALLRASFGPNQRGRVDYLRFEEQWKPFQNAKVTTAWKKPEAEARLRCSMCLWIMNYNSAGHVMTQDAKSQEPEKWKVPQIPCIDQSHIPGGWMVASTTINSKPTWMSVSSSFWTMRSCSEARWGSEGFRLENVGRTFWVGCSKVTWCWMSLNYSNPVDRGVIDKVFEAFEANWRGRGP